MEKVAIVIAIEQTVVTAPSQSHKIQFFGSKVSNGVVPNALKQKFIVVFNVR